MSKIGEKMTCKIWSGEMLGVSIGATKRSKHFRKRHEDIVIEIEGQYCKVNRHKTFWSTCPEIRVAENKNGFNVLSDWISRHNLLPQNRSLQEKGKIDTVTLEVIEPFQRFRLSL